uniref:Uncharacterized protein n=1 Tax=Oryza barthii TaxID=65489 RepID=A0A0D3FA48_9ORYZ
MVAGSLRSLARRPAAVRLSATPPVRHSDEAATPPLLACRCASPVAAVSAPTLPLLARINLCSNSRYPSRRYRLASHRPPIPRAREVVACSTAGSSSAPVPPSAFALRFRPSPAAFIPSNRASLQADDDIFVLFTAINQAGIMFACTNHDL